MKNENKKDYTLKVICRNCGTKQEIFVPFGVDIIEIGNGTDKILSRRDGKITTEPDLSCFNCGSLRLSRIIK